MWLGGNKEKEENAAETAGGTTPKEKRRRKEKGRGLKLPYAWVYGHLFFPSLSFLPFPLARQFLQ